MKGITRRSVFFSSSRSISLHQAHAFGYILVNKDVVYCWGNNEHGQLLNKNPAIVYFPTRISLPFAPTMIKGGASHTLALDEKGKVWGWGLNTFYQLGVNHDKNLGVPTSLEHFLKSPIKDIDCGGVQSVAIDTEGDVWAWGWNNVRKLGFDHDNQVTVPTKHTNVPVKFKSVASGGAHTLLIDENNEVWGFGDNNFGQLGIVHPLRTVPIQKQQTLKNIVQVACGIGFFQFFSFCFIFLLIFQIKKRSFSR